MYHYVEDKDFLKRAQKTCSGLMAELEEELRENGINSQFFLVGSGARNMVTQNKEEPIDFDYNLNMVSCDTSSDCKAIKEAVRKAFNNVLKRHKLPDCDDSTSSLTMKKIYFEDDNSIEFSIDVGIVVKGKNGNWFRLKHEKLRSSYSDRYYWNEAPSSNGYSEKAKAIKSIPGWWEKARKRYLEIKNDYLRENDHTHPSFVCYIQAVNDVYNQMRQKGIL